jgi:uncharacterized protein (DUF302 family)
MDQREKAKNSGRLSSVRRTRKSPATAGALSALALAAALVGPASSSASASAAPGHASGVNAPLLTATTSKSFSSTVSSFKRAVSSAGMMVLGQLNQAGALSVTGLHLKGAETFFVGNPTVGKKFFEMDPAVGAVLPVRMYIFVNSAGRTEIGYLEPSKLAAAVDPKLGGPVSMLDMAASKIVRAVTGSEPKASSTAVSLSFVSVRSTRSFASTVSSLKTAVSSAGMMVLGQLNQAGALSVTGLQLKGALPWNSCAILVSTSSTPCRGNFPSSWAC